MLENSNVCMKQIFKVKDETSRWTQANDERLGCCSWRRWIVGTSNCV